MSLRFGSFPVVVGSSVDMARLFLKTHDLAFIDRPQTAAGKLCQAELFNNARRLTSLEHVRSEEVRAMVRDLHAAASSPSSSSAAGCSSGHVVALKEHLYMVNLNVISRMLLGKKYIVDGYGSPATPEEFRWLIDEHFFLNGVLNIADMIPWLSCLDPQGYIKGMKRSAKMLDLFLEHVLDEHNERRRREGQGFFAMDMMDVLLELAD
ncbi:unnamed protein product [Miscanthus lutarioriparius]|uniref:Cytochrome P450 n=1 Tax=Miscanthus lutarioriparius TaxID=422564 RepID=A0A811MEP7_9POAL|nr:unnamed protein product [Miscanthus lutarioriparius]